MKPIIIKPVKPVLILFIFCMLFTICIILVAVILSISNKDSKFMFYSIFSPFSLFIGFHIRQWWVITEDKIVVKNLYCVINSIRKDQINEVELIRLSIARTEYYDCYVINGNGRVKTNDLFYNKRGQPMKIPVNDISSGELKKYL